MAARAAAAAAACRCFRPLLNLLPLSPLLPRRAFPLRRFFFFYEIPPYSFFIIALLSL